MVCIADACGDWTAWLGVVLILAAGALGVFIVSQE